MDAEWYRPVHISTFENASCSCLQISDWFKHYDGLAAFSACLRAKYCFPRDFLSSNQFDQQFSRRPWKKEVNQELIWLTSKLTLQATWLLLASRRKNGHSNIYILAIFCLSVSACLCLSVSVSVCLSVCLSVYLCLCLCLSESLCLSLSLCLSSLSLSLCLSLCLCLSLSLFLSLSLSLSVSVSLSLSMSLSLCIVLNSVSVNGRSCKKYPPPSSPRGRQLCRKMRNSLS